jgi:membrane protease YdiL (CAAX protease family)
VWTLVAGTFSIAALAGYWIVFFGLVRMEPNALPDISRYSLVTLVPIGIVASLVSPITEEAAFRGYCQGILERHFSGTTAIVITSVLFALAHLTQGFYWPKLLVYFMTGVALGIPAYVSNSTIPSLPVHILADMTFFALVWPGDAGRKLVWEVGADKWFYIHIAQAVLFTLLAAWAFAMLARVAAAIDAKRGHS